MNRQAVAAILQARTGSSRLPGKVMADLGGRPLIAFLIERLKRCEAIGKLVLATTTHSDDDGLVDLCKEMGLIVVRGSQDDVLSRFALAAQTTKASVLVRVTGDCPFLDPGLISKAILEFEKQKVDYLSNCFPATFPDGLDIEVFSKDVLLQANTECKSISFREHVTPWIRENQNFRIGYLKSSVNYSSLRWTVDESEDLKVIRNVVSHFKGSSDFDWHEILNLYQNQPEIFEANKKFLRNEGATISKGQKLWRRAKRIIPGGNMLLSKRAEMFLPGKWPSYFSRAKGCRVWDLEGNELIDMSMMGIGTNLLGYSHPEVDAAVTENVNLGNMSTLNCPEEVLLAERLVGMHSWADMARFARSGGEANAIAIRIARASTGKDTVAICGYHGWHDWYLATNLQNDSGLSEHLLPTLKATGVPNCLSGSVHPFSFNRFDQLEEISNNYELAAVKMEVQRSISPNPGFLEDIRQLCTNKGIVLIFDECTSGFRETFGGLHKKYNVDPDMAIFGKAIGNGFAITATIGKRSVMEAAQNSFISSTFWTERIGPTAALKTLEIMERETSWQAVTNKGLQLRKAWQKLADKKGLEITHFGIPALAGFSIKSSKAMEYKTLITQEMLKKGYLASTSCYLSTAHTPEVLNEYLENLELIFDQIAQCENGRSIEELLDGPVCHSEMRRLN